MCWSAPTMSKIRIYVEPGKILDVVKIDDNDTVHKIKDVLRLREDSAVYVFDGKGSEYFCKVKEMRKNEVILIKENLSRKEKYQEKKIVLGFPLLKEEKIDFILQKATELGVYSFVPFVCRNSIQKNPSSLKLLRWEKIIIEAARQSGRLWIPGIDQAGSFQEVMDGKYEVKLVACAGKEKFNPGIVKNYKNILIIVGPEGDFSDSEFAVMNENGFLPVNLSMNILRVETAAIFAVGLLNFL